MGAVVDLSGQRFGQLVVLERAPNIGKVTIWKCRCDCGNDVFVQRNNLRSGNTASCGCVRNRLSGKRLKEIRKTCPHPMQSHGMRRSPEYRLWAGMKQRCSNPNTKSYSRYGARGITICDRWRDSFENFFADMGPRPSPKHSLDRIKNDRGYEPGNVRWATKTQQARNQSTNVCVVYEGRLWTLSELAAHLGLDYKSLHWFHRQSELPLDEAIRKASRSV